MRAPRMRVRTWVLAAALLAAPALTWTALAVSPSDGPDRPDHPFPPPGVAVGWHRNHDGEPTPEPGPGPGPGPGTSDGPGPSTTDAPADAASTDSAPLVVDLPPTPEPNAIADAPATSTGPFSPRTPSDAIQRGLPRDITDAPAAGGAVPWLAPTPPAPPVVAPPPAALLPIVTLPPLALVDVVAAGVTLAAAASSASLLRAPRVREWFSWLLTPLYTRVARADVLEHEARSALYDLVESEPGIHLSELKREAGLPNGTMLHHLRVLERNGYVHSRPDGRLRRYFATGAVVGFEGAPALDEQVFRFVTTHPAATNAQIASALHKRPTLVHYHLGRLEQRGQVKRERVGREVRLYATA